MNALKEQIVQVIFASVTVLNGEETEEDLNMAISEKILQSNLEEIKKNLITERLESEADSEEIIENGVFVYSYESMSEWLFNKYSTMADAIRAAVKILNASVISNGKVITYDIIDNESAYYIDDNAGKMKIVNL